MAGERRRYLRVLFEETIQVETEDWTDSMATGLDISLNGTRFHCEHSLSEGGTVEILFRPGLKLKGEVRWCWPIEWYYQAAVEFVDLSSEEQALLRDYISETTGEPYPEYSEEEGDESENTEEEIVSLDDTLELEDPDDELDLEASLDDGLELEVSLETELEDEDSLLEEELALGDEESLLEEELALEEDDDDIILEDDPIEEDSLEDDPIEDDILEEDSLEEDILEEDDLLEEPPKDPNLPKGMLTPLAFAEKQIVIVDNDDARIESLSDYLTKRNHFSVSHTDRASRLWPLLKGTRADLILLYWGLEENGALELLKGIQNRFPGTPVVFLAGSVSLEERLEGLNEGASDFITFPVALSAVSQCILQQLAPQSTPSAEQTSEKDLVLEEDDGLDFNDDYLDEDLEL